MTMEADPRADGLAGVDPPQRFTPGWLARWLARGALVQATPGQPLRCLDPACGGGRLLLALYEALRARGFTPHDALGALVGFDLDPNAAQVARWSLWMRASRETPHPHTLPTPLIFAPDDASSDLARLGALAPWDALARASHGLIAPAAL
jgi:SAM-dependent methyltransferase